MSDTTWSEVDRYFADHLLADADPVFEAVLRANAAAGLPAIDVSPLQGKFLNLIVRLSGASRILEFGTLGGYSTIWMAKGLRPGGRVVSLEFSEKHAKVARENVARVGLLESVEIRTGAALDLAPKLLAEGQEPFDMVFIDADKPNNPGYLDWAVKLSRLGGLVILDNVVRDGRVVDSGSTDPAIKGTRAAFELLREHPLLDATAIQTVGLKGYDGFVLGIVR